MTGGLNNSKGDSDKEKNDESSFIKQQIENYLGKELFKIAKTPKDMMPSIS